MTITDSSRDAARCDHPRARAATLCAVVAMLFALAFAARPAAAEPAFDAFVAALWPEAQAIGISQATFDRAFAGLTPDRTLPDLILPGRTVPDGKGQAEFTKTPLEYLNVPYLLSLAAQGRQLATRHAATLAAIETELGVDRHILLAIWGRETAYGQYKLPYDAVRVLATQSYLGRRKEMFRKELLALLRMIEDRVFDPATMKASWAGAIGLTQFMPSEYAALAYDMDKDGKKDIWTSIPDALASAANQLKAKGWVSGQPWGFEVRPPAATACLAEGQPNAKPLADWAGSGFVRTGGKALPAALMSQPAFLLTPGGSYGPAFLVFENFMVLKRYNFADLYAVFVGHLADRMAGGGDFEARWATPKLISTGDIADVQTRLKAAGHPVEKIDGKAGMNTRNLIGHYQRAAGLAVDCWPSAALLVHMRRLAGR